MLEPFNKFGQVVEGTESGFERPFRHGTQFQIPDDCGAVEFADQCFDCDVYAYQQVIVLQLVAPGADTTGQVGQGDAKTYDFGFFFVLQLHEGHFGSLESVAVEQHFEVLAFGLMERDDLPPIDIGCIVG